MKSINDVIAYFENPHCDRLLRVGVGDVLYSVKIPAGGVAFDTSVASTLNFQGLSPEGLTLRQIEGLPVLASDLSQEVSDACDHASSKNPELRARLLEADIKGHEAYWAPKK